MMLAVWLVLAPGNLEAIDCTPASITLSSQADVDNFQTNHGPCDRVVGTLTVSGAGITNLDGLAGLVSLDWTEINNNGSLTDIGGLSSVIMFTGPVFIHGNTSLANVNGLTGMTTLPGGALFIEQNFSLSDLSGLANLGSIGASLGIWDNDSLADLDDLTGLTHVAASISINGNASLTSISGLSGLTGFTASFTVRDNPVLGSLDGMQGTASLAGLVIDNNDSLTNLDGLSGLTTIGNGISSLFIDDNAVLADLDGLADLESLDADLEITDNPALERCLGLVILLDGVDDGTPGPGPGPAGIPDVNGDVILSGNLTGCNSLNEILDQVIFTDRFESGSTSAWSATTP